jgi:hypothetical protein
MLSLWTIWTFVRSCFFKQKFLEIVFCSARDCSISIEDNGDPVPGVTNNVLNDRSLFCFLFYLKNILFIIVCFNCSRTGHIAATCPEDSRTDMRDVICYW